MISNPNFASHETKENAIEDWTPVAEVGRSSPSASAGKTGMIWAELDSSSVMLDLALSLLLENGGARRATTCHIESCSGALETSGF